MGGPSSELQLGTVDVGGVSATQEQVAQAVEILEVDHSTNVKLPLQRRGNPLWKMDYHGIAEVYYTTHPKLSPGTPAEHVAHVKRAVVYCLKKVLENLDQSLLPGSAVDQALADAEQAVEQEAAAVPPPADDYDARQRRTTRVRTSGHAELSASNSRMDLRFVGPAAIAGSRLSVVQDPATGIER